jgi:Zn-dependent protease
LLAGITAAGIFLCLILHELGHALVGRRFGIRFRSIRLFIFGGVAEMETEPPSAKAELWMAAAGPAVSLLLAGWFAAAGQVLTDTATVAVARELALINFLLVCFNLVPAFPLDGGRILRAILWGRTGNLRRATALASTAGNFFGTALLVLGIFTLLGGQVVAGLWWMVLGWFLKNAAQASYQQVVVREILTGDKVRDLMTTQVTSVSPDLEVADLVDQYVYRQHHEMFPVRTNGRLLGYVSTRQIKEVPRDEWPVRRVAEVMASDLKAVEIAPDADAMAALEQMQRSGHTRLLVVDDGVLVGILTLRDLLDVLRLRTELEADEPRG